MIEDITEKPSRSWGKIILIALIVIILINGAIFGAYYYINKDKPKIIDKEVDELSDYLLNCLDPDGYNIYQQARIDYSYNYSGEIHQGSIGDICEYPAKYGRIGIVKEMVCEEGELIAISSTCGKGLICRDGMCVTGSEESYLCSEGDNGKNAYVAGETSLGGVTAKDDCWISTSQDLTQGSLINECPQDMLEKCYVYEYFCDGDLRNYEIIKCPNGCLNGACK